MNDHYRPPRRRRGGRPPNRPEGDGENNPYRDTSMEMLPENESQHHRDPAASPPSQSRPLPAREHTPADSPYADDVADRASLADAAPESSSGESTASASASNSLEGDVGTGGPADNAGGARGAGPSMGSNEFAAAPRHDPGFQRNER